MRMRFAYWQTLVPRALKLGAIPSAHNPNSFRAFSWQKKGPKPEPRS